MLLEQNIDLDFQLILRGVQVLIYRQLAASILLWRHWLFSQSLQIYSTQSLESL